jgi:hypothetical protein
LNYCEIKVGKKGNILTSKATNRSFIINMGFSRQNSTYIARNKQEESSLLWKYFGKKK